MATQAAEARIQASEREQRRGSPDAKERLRHLTSRESALREELVAARAAEAHAIETLEARRQGLATGEGTAADVAKARKAAEAARETVVDLEGAVEKIAAERRSVAEEIEREENARERRRQEKAAEPLREEADRLLGEFVEAIATVTAPLLKRVEVMERLGQEFPLVREIEPIQFDALVIAVAERLRLPTGDRPDLAVRSWLTRILAGPTGVPWMPVPTVGPETLRAHGLR